MKQAPLLIFHRSEEGKNSPAIGFLSDKRGLLQSLEAAASTVAGGKGSGLGDK